MLKLVFLLSFATVLYGWDWSDDDYVTGIVGKWVHVNATDRPFCQPWPEGLCTSGRGCCHPRVCWMDGRCREKLPEYYSIEGFEYITGKVGQYQRYDGCNNNRKRRGEACDKTSDCCFPLDCRSGYCMLEREDDLNIADFYSLFSAGMTLTVRPVLGPGR